MGGKFNGEKTVKPSGNKKSNKIKLSSLSPQQIQYRLNHHRSQFRKAEGNPEKQKAIQAKIDALTGERKRRKGGKPAKQTAPKAEKKVVKLSELSGAQIQQRLNHHRSMLKKYSDDESRVAEIQKKIDVLTGERKRRNGEKDAQRSAKRIEAARLKGKPKSEPAPKPERKAPEPQEHGPQKKEMQGKAVPQKESMSIPSVQELNPQEQNGHDMARQKAEKAGKMNDPAYHKEQLKDAKWWMGLSSEYDSHKKYHGYNRGRAAFHKAMLDQLRG